MTTESAGSDPTRGLELLWGAATGPRRGPKPGLDLARIVRAAMDVADHDGLQAVSMRRVATELDVGTATLYTYVPGRTELLALMLDTVAGYSTLPHTFPGDWRARFEAWAHEDWEIFSRHPWTVELVSNRLLPGPNMFAWQDSALRVLADTGLSEAEKVASIQTLDSYVRGTVWSTAEVGDRAGEGADVSDADWLARRNVALAKLVDFSRYPALLQALGAGVDLQGAQTFELGLARILDGIEALIKRHLGW